MPPLTQHVALVAGATRGAGRGIAVMLGEAGATVYCTGRSTVGAPPAAGFYAGRPETVEETAALVTARGGRGIACRVDHADPDQVRALADRLAAAEGRLDSVVMDFWGDESPVPFGTPFWQIDPARGRATIERTLWPHVLTLQQVVPLLLRPRAGDAPPPLVVEVTDGPTLDYRTSLFYDLAAMLRARLAWAAAHELAPHGVTVVAVTPGYLRTEYLLDHLGVSEATWRDALPAHPDLAASESPCLLGRGIAALAADRHSARLSGGLYGSWMLAAEYNLTDADGSRPDFGREIARREGRARRKSPMGAWHVTQPTALRYRTPAAAARTARRSR